MIATLSAVGIMMLYQVTAKSPTLAGSGSNLTLAIPVFGEELFGNSEAPDLLLQVPDHNLLLPAGIYESLPCTGIIISPDPVPDEKMASVPPGVIDSMAIVRPHLRFIPANKAR